MITKDNEKNVIRTDAEKLNRLVIEVLQAAGAESTEANAVASELVETSLMGIDSHGVLRLPQYVRQLQEGSLVSGREPVIKKKTSNTFVVDGQMGFGMVTARFMTDLVAEAAQKQNIACAVSRQTHHVGRLGSYVEKLARHDLFGFAVANASRQGHYVTPWGGTEGRLGTNPLAYGCPTDDEPIVLDMSTSAISEGEVRALCRQGERVPEDCLLDPEGTPTTNPEDFYRDDWGAILPFGGAQGYKGYGLSLLVELLGSTLAGVPLTPDGENDTYINGFFIMAIDPDAFCGREVFKNLVNELVEYVKSSPAAGESGEVFLPGEIECSRYRRNLTEGVDIAVGIWAEIVEAAGTVGLSEEQLEVLLGDGRYETCVTRNARIV